MKNILYPAILQLEDGTLYHGWSLSNSIISVGEVVFNTGMTGYQEIITDPSYCGQIVTFTYTEIGNTGINNEDNECKTLYIKGIIAKNICLKSSNWRSRISFIQYIKENEIPHIFGIDTRALTKHLRNNGVMNGCISSQGINNYDLKAVINQTPHMQGQNLVNEVTTKQQYILTTNNDTRDLYKNYLSTNAEKEAKLLGSLNIVVLDLGVKQNILNILLNYGCRVNILPAQSTCETVLSYKPDGILLSNGPGDPATMTDIISNVKQIIKKSNVPLFGVCMGHQILSLSLGGNTFKMKFGHRGINHPTGIGQKAEVTSQNHGFAVQKESLAEKHIYITHLNLNDSTVAGIIYKNKPIFSVQYHPEASPGPHDTNYLFSHFINLAYKTKLKNELAYY